MRKEVRRFIKEIAEYRDYDRADTIDVLALAALKERMLGISNDRAVEGILTNAYAWDFMPRDVQNKAVSWIFYRIGYSWGFDQASVIKLAALICLIDISPSVKTTVREIYLKPTAGTFSVHGLYSYL